MGKPIVLEPAHIEAIARALVESKGGLSHQEITYYLDARGMDSQSADLARWKRVFNGFASSLNRTQNTDGVFWFIRDATNPARFVTSASDYEDFRHGLNTALALVGVGVNQSGKLIRLSQASTLPEAEKRARELRADLVSRGVHLDVLAFCRAELVGEDYFHAVLEATKSIAHKLRQRTGLLDDGAVLVNHVFGGDRPILTINPFVTKSEKDEQKGFCNLLVGTFGMFRNPTAHEARVLWEMTKEDAEDLLSLVSLIHRRIDKAVMPPRV